MQKLTKEDIICADTETRLIGPRQLAPEPMCYSFASTKEAGVVSNGDKNFLEKILEHFKSGKILVFHNSKYDLHVLGQQFPEIYEIIREMLDDGLIHDTVIREKLLNLTTVGWITDGEDNRGRYVRKGYDLNSLLKQYLGIDKTEEKKSEDAWRLRYHELDGMPASLYPREAFDYALEDSTLLVGVWEAQEERRQYIIESQGFDPFAVLDLQVAADFYFYFMSMEGVHLDHEAIVAKRQMLAEELTLEKIQLLLDNDIVVPAQPEQVQKRGDTIVISHVDGCDRKKDKTTKTWICDCPPKMKKATEEKTSRKDLKEYILSLFKEGIITDIAWTPKGKEDEEFQAIILEGLTYEILKDNMPYMAVNSDWLLDNAYLDPVLLQFQHRAGLQKILTTELPRMMLDREKQIPADVIHGNYDILKNTGRTSSYGTDLYPSANLQNIYKKVRDCFMSRKGFWMMSTDYSGLEFVSAAQRALDFIGRSKYAEIINSGKDAHAYLACHRALDQKFFYEECESLGILGNDDAIYEQFMTHKALGTKCFVGEKEVDFWVYYRTSAKPIGLGILGGMGPATIASTSHNTYRFDMTEEEAKEYREIWRRVMTPEAELIKYFSKNMKDYDFSTKKHPKYVYTSPLGMRRPNCTYSAGLNGMTLQTSSAEGAKLGTMMVIEEARFDKESILYGNYFPWAFVHDEIMADVVADRKIATACAERVEEILCNALNAICPDINPSADTALMLTWSKQADEVRDDEGYLIPWVAA